MTSDSTLTSKFTTLGKESSMYAAGSVIGRLAGIVLIPLYTSVLASSEYGIMGLVIITGQIAGVLFALGLRAAMLRSYYDHEDGLSRITIISTSIVITIISGAVLLALSFVISGPLSGHLFGTAEYGSFFVLVLSYAVTEMFSQLALEVFRARRKPGRFVVFQTLSLILRTGIIVYLVAYKHWGIKGVLAGQLIASVIVTVIMFWFIRDCLVPRFSQADARKMLRYGGPLIFVGIFGFVSNYIDRYILNHYVTLEEVGLYTLAYQLGMLINVMLIAPLKRVWGPAFLSAKDHDNCKDFCAKAFTYVIAIAGFVFLGVSLLSKELLLMISDPQYWDSYKVIPIIALTYAIWSTRSIIEVGVVIKRKTAVIAIYTFIGAAINIVLNIIMIPRYGMTGAAWATLISFVVTLAIDYAYNRKLFRIEYEWARVAKVSLISALLFSAGYFYVIDNIWLSIAFKAGLLILYPVMFFVIGFFEDPEKRKIKQIVQKALSRKK